MRLVSVALLTAVAAGCGTSYNDGLNRDAELTGTVYLDGAALGGGRVECRSEDGKYSVVGTIDPHGRYALKEPPLGSCKLAVKTDYLKNAPARSAKGGGKNNPGGSAGMVTHDDVGLKYLPIPPKYEEPDTAGLPLVIEKGNQTYDIRLTN